MKKCFLILTLWMLIASVSVSALAQTQDEFELSCREKTSSAAVIYVSEDALGAPVNVLPAGTCVQVLNCVGGIWREILWMDGGVCRSGWTDAELESCVDVLTDVHGFAWGLHENDPQYDEKLDQMEDEGALAQN